MKKSQLPHYLLPITYFLGLTPLVRAGPIQGVYQLTDGLREVIRILIQFISETILQIDSFDEFLFAKLLLFTLILLVVYTVISKNTLFGGRKNGPIQWIISSAVAILSIRYLPNEFIQAILLQYGAFAVGITVFLPLIIYFTFIHQSGVGPFGRKIAWLVYIIGFFALWSIRWKDMGSANWIYWIAIGFIIIAMIFDKSIHEYMGWIPIRKIEKQNKARIRAGAIKRKKELMEDRENWDDEKEWEREMETVNKTIKENK